MNERSKTGRDEAIAYYTDCWVKRFVAGHNPRSSAIHYGLQSDPTIDPEDAKLRMNLHVVERLGLDPTTRARVVDLGCGVGGTTVDLARRFVQWELWGVDQTPASIAFATQRAHDAGLDARVRFVEADFTHTGLNQAFDGAYAIESACHAFDRASLTREMHRLLRPGGTVVVADFFRTSRPLGETDARRYEVLKRGFAIGGRA